MLVWMQFYEEPRITLTWYLTHLSTYSWMSKVWSTHPLYWYRRGAQFRKWRTSAMLSTGHTPSSLIPNAPSDVSWWCTMWLRKPSGTPGVIFWSRPDAVVFHQLCSFSACYFEIDILNGKNEITLVEDLKNIQFLWFSSVSETSQFHCRYVILCKVENSQKKSVENLSFVCYNGESES